MEGRVPIYAWLIVSQMATGKFARIASELRGRSCGVFRMDTCATEVDVLCLSFCNSEGIYCGKSESDPARAVAAG